MTPGLVDAAAGQSEEGLLLGTYSSRERGERNSRVKLGTRFMTCTHACTVQHSTGRVHVSCLRLQCQQQLPTCCSGWPSVQCTHAAPGLRRPSKHTPAARPASQPASQQPWQQPCSLAADHLVLVVLAGQDLQGGLDDAAAQAQHQMQRGLLLDVVVGQGAAVLQLLAGEDQALLVRGDACGEGGQAERGAGGTSAERGAGGTSAGGATATSEWDMACRRLLLHPCAALCAQTLLHLADHALRCSMPAAPAAACH